MNAEMEEFESFIVYNKQSVVYKANVPIDVETNNERSEHFGARVSEEVSEVTYDVENTEILFARTENGTDLKITEKLHRLILDDIQATVDRN